MDVLDKLDILAGIDDEFILSAENSGKKKTVWKTLLPAAAAFIIILGAAIYFGKTIKKPSVVEKEANGPLPSQIVVSDAPTEEPTETPVITESATEPPRQTSVELQPSIVYDYSYEGRSKKWGFNYPMFIYHGKIYSLFAICDPLSDLLGQKIGTIDSFTYDPGSNDESGSSEPPVIELSDYEMTGNSTGSIFTVKGFDPEIMLCQRYSEGEIALFLNFNEWTMKKGSDFLEDVLHLSENFSVIDYYFKSDNKKRELDKDVYAEAVNSFIDALNNGEWVKDDRSEASPYCMFDLIISGEDEWVCDFYLDIPLNNGLYASIYVYTDNVAVINSSINGYALKLDPEKVEPIKDLIKKGEGTLAVSSTTLALEKCRNNDRFGDYVPKIIPDGYWINLTYIDYDVDLENGIIRGTNRMRIDYKCDYEGYTILMWILPLEDYETSPDVHNYLEKGCKVIELENLTVDDIYSEGSVANDDALSYVTVTYRDACIYVWAVDTEAKPVYDLLRSILD